MPVTLSNLSALNVIAGFDLGTLFNNGSLTIPDGQFSTSVMIPGDAIAKAIISAGVDPVQNGIPLFEALAGAQYDNLSAQSLIQLLFVYARQAGTGTAVAQDVGTAIATLVPATLSATQAISYIVQSAVEITTDSSLFGSTSTVNANTTGQLLGTVLAQLQAVLGSDPIAAGVQDLLAVSGGLGTTQFNMLAALGLTHAASVATGFEGLLGANAQSLTNSDLTLASPSAGTHIANAAFAQYGSNSTGFAVGAALIEALAQQHSADPVPALVYFTYQLASLTGGISTVVQTALSAFISNALVINATAQTDITTATIAIAAGTTTTAQAVLIGEVFADLLNKTGSGVVATAVNAAAGSPPAVIAAIGSTLSYTQGLGLLVGVGLAANGIGGNSTIWSEIGHEISTLVTNSDVTQAQVVNLLTLYQADGLTSPYMTSSGLTFAQLATDLITAVQTSQVTATQALTYMGSLYSFLGATSSLDDATITLAASLINNGRITATAAFAAIHTTDTPTIFGILATTSATAAGVIANYQYLLDNGYFPAGGIGGISRAGQITGLQSGGSLSPLYNNALPPGVVAASGATNADAPSGATLSFASLPAGVGVGFLVVDQTNPGSIAQNTRVSSISGNTVTLSGNVAADVVSGDTIAFYNQGIGLAIELLAVTPSTLDENQTPDNAIYVYVNNGAIGATEALSIAANAVAAGGGSVAQQIAELALIAANSSLNHLFDDVPNGDLIAAAPQEILALSDGASLTAAQVASAFALAYGDAAADGNLVQESFIISVLTDIGGLTHNGGQSAEPFVAAVLANLISTSGSATASQPLTPIAAASDIAGGQIASSDNAVALLISVAGAVPNAGFDFHAGQAIAEGIDFHRFINYFPTTLSAAVTAGTIDNADAALLLGSVATVASGIQSTSQTADFITTLAGFATNDSSVIPAFGTAVAGGYDAYIAIEALALIGGGAPGLETAVQNEIVSILQAGGSSLSGDNAVFFLAGAAQLVANSQMSATLEANVLSGIAGDIAAIIGGNLGTTVTSAVTEIGGLVGSQLGTAPNVAANMVTLLEYLATYDTTYGGPVADIEQTASGAAAGTLSVQAEIALILGAHEISATTVITTLDTLDTTVASGSPLDMVISGELDLIDTTGAALLLSAAQGAPSAPTLQTQALKISQLGDNLAASGATNATSSGTTLTFASLPTGAAAGLVVVDLTNPGAIALGTTVASTSGSTVTLSASVASAVNSGDDIAFYRTPFDSAATNGQTSTGKVLSFGSLPVDVVQGLTVLDLSNPAAFAAGTYVASVSGSMVTLSAGVAATVGSGDTIAFFQPGISDVLDALVGNVGGSVFPADAITLLLDLAAIGAANTSNPALADATAALVALATSNTPGTDAATIVSDINSALINHNLTSSAGLSILAALAKASVTAEGYVQSSYAGGLITGYFTIAQIDAAVTAGTVQALDAIAALSQAAGATITASSPAVTVPGIAAEIVKILQAHSLDTNTVLGLLTAPSPNQSLLELATDIPIDLATGLPNLSIVTAGYSAINTIVTAIPGLGQGFFSAILNLTSEFPTFPEIVTSAEAELFGSGGLVATGAVNSGIALSAVVGFPISQQLAGLVLLAGVPAAQSAVINYIEEFTGGPAVASGPTNAAGSGATINLASVTGSLFQGAYAVDLTNIGAIAPGITVSTISGDTVTLSGSASAVGDGDTIGFYNPNSYNPYITTDTVIAAFATAYGGASAFTDLYETLLAHLGENATGAAAFITVLEQSNATPSQQLGVLVNLVADYQPAAIEGAPGFQGIVNTLVTRMDSLLISGTASPAALASALDTLLNNGVFTGAQVIQTVAGFYDVTAPQEFIAVVDALPAAGINSTNITTGIVDAVTDGALSAQLGVDLMLVVGTETTPALQTAAAAAFGAAIANNSAIAVNASTNIGVAISSGVATTSQVVTFMTQALLTTPSILSFASTEIGSMVTAHGLSGLAVITAMAQALAPNALVASSATSGASASGNILDFASVPAGVSLPQSVVDLTNPGAIAPFTAVIGVTGTTVTLSQSVAAAVASGDTIAFYDNLTEDSAIWGQIAVLGAAITSVTGGFGFTALQEANAILAAVGYNTADLSPDYGIALLASFAGSGNIATLEAVGQAVAALVLAGTAMPNQVAGAFDASYIIGGVTTPAKLNSVIVGLLAGGSLAAAAELGFDIGFAQEPVSALAATLSTAVSANTITALEGVDLAANLGLQDPATLTIIAPLLASGAITGQAAVQELGTFIGATQAGNGLSVFSATEFISVFDALAGASTGATQSSMGIGLAAVIASGKLSPGAAAAGLRGAVGGTLTVDQALTILIGAAAGSFSLAAGETIAALVAGNPTATQTAISDVETAVTSGALTVTQGLTLLAGVVDGGVPAAAQAAADLLQALTISVSVGIDQLAGAAIAGTVPIRAAVSIVAATYPAAVTIDAGSHGGTDFTGSVISELQSLIAQGNFSLSLAGQAFGGPEMQLTGPGDPSTLVGDTVSGPGIAAGTTVTGLDGSFLVLNQSAPSGSGTYVFTPPSDFTVLQQIVAVLPPATDLANLIDLLVNLGTAAGITALGQTLFSIIESGAATPGAVVAAIQATGATGGTYTVAPLFALGSLAQTAAAQPSGTYAVDPATIESDVYSAIIAMYPPSANGPTETAAQFVAQYLGGLVQQGGLFKTNFLPVMVQLAVRDPSDYLTGSGSEFNTLLGSGAISVTDLMGALTAAGVSGGAALVVLAGAIDIGVLTGTVQINQNATVENQLLLAYRLVTGSVVSATNLQSYATALQTAVGLPVQNAVGGLALLFAAVTAFDGGGVSLAGFVQDANSPGRGIGAAIASLVSSGQITEANAYTIIGQTYQATGFAAAALPSLMGLVGYDLNDTAAAFAAAVAAGSYGGNDATIDILARLTGITGQETGSIPEPAADGSNNGALVFPNIGLAVGTELVGLVVAHGFSLSQILGDIAAIPFNTGNITAVGADPGVSDNNKLLILLGMLNGAAASGVPGPGGIATGNAPMQIAIGATLGNLLNAGAQLDLSLVRGVITYDQWALLLAGVVTTANTATATGIAQLFGLLNEPAQNIFTVPQEFASVDLPVPTGALSASQLASDLDTAVRAGALSAAGGLATLEVFAAGVPAATGTMGTEVLALINEGQITAPAAIAALAARAGGGSLDMQAVAGGFIGAIENNGLAGDSVIAATIDGAITGNSLTSAQAAVIDGAAAISGSRGLAATLGADIGTMIANSEITVANAVSAIASGASTYAYQFTALGINTDLTNEVVMLAGVATTATVAGAQLALGEAIGTLVNQNDVRTPAEAVAAVGNATGNAPGDLTPAQAIQVLIGVAATAGSTVPVGTVLTEVAVGGEFAALIGAGTLTSSDVTGGLGQAIQAGTLSATIGFAVLVSMAAQNGSLASAVTTEIAALINGHVVTADQALAGLFAAAGFEDFIGVPAATDGTIAQIVTRLESQGSITPAQIGQDMIAAATGGSIAADHAINILLAVFADAPNQAAGQGALDAIAGLLSNGIGTTALLQDITNELTAGTITLGTAMSTLIGIANSADAAFPAVDIVVGSAMAPFVNLSQLPDAQFVGLLQSAVAGGSLTTAVEAQLLAQTAVSLIWTVNGIASNAALPQGLIQLAENGSPTAAQIFGDIEALAAAQGGNYDTPNAIMTGFGVLIAELAIGANPTLQAAVAGEFASLVSRNLITAAQAGNYIGIAAANGLSADTAVLLYAAGIPAPLIAGAGIAGLVNQGGLPLTQALSDMAAAVPGTLSVDGETKIVAAMANDLTGAGSLNTLSSALIQLIENQTATATQVFNDLAAVAQLAGSYSTALGTVLVGIAGTSDMTLQTAVSNEIASLINAGTLSGISLVGAIGAAQASGQLTAAQADILLIPLLPTAGPALQAAIGAGAGPSQAAAFIAAQGAGTITATTLVGVLTGMATDAVGAPNGATATAASFIAPYILANGSGFLASTASGIGVVRSLSVGATILSDFVSVNQFQGSNPLNAEFTFNSDLADLSFHLSFSDHEFLQTTYGASDFLNENTTNSIAQALGGFGSNSAQVQFETAAAASQIPLSDLANTLNSFVTTGALAPAAEIVSLVTNGTLTVSQVMAAIDAAAPSVAGSGLVYFLASLSLVPALQAAAAQEIAKLVQEGVLTGAAAASDIAAIANAMPGDNSALAAIPTSNAISLLLAVYADSTNTALRSAVPPQLVSLFVNPPSDITQVAIVSAVGNAVTNGQMTAAMALQTLIQMDGAGAPGAAGPVGTALEGLVARYVGSSYSAFTTQLLAEAASVTSPGALTSLGWLLGAVTIPESGFTTAIGTITAAEQAGTITGAQEASMLLGLFPVLLSLYNNIVAPLPDAIPAATTAQSRLQLINQWISAGTSANSAVVSIVTDVVALVSSGAITAQALIADIAAAGTVGPNQSGALTSAQRLQLLVALSGGDVAAQPAVTTALVGTTNTFDTRAYPQVVLDVIKMSAGTMTLDQAILDVQEYAYTHNADVNSALNELLALTEQASAGGSDIPATVPYTTAGNSGITVVGSNALSAGNLNLSDIGAVTDGRFFDGATAGDLAVEVAEGVAGLLPNAPSLTQAENEFSGFQQAAFYNDVIGVAYNLRLTLPQNGPANAALTSLLGAVPLQQNHFPASASNLFWTPFNQFAPTTVSSASTLTTGFFSDQAMAAEIHALSGVSSSAAANNTQLIVDRLADDLTDGYAETSIINMLASGQFENGDQDAISALNDLLVPVMANESALAAQSTQALSYAWLAMKSVQYIEGNYQIVTNPDGSQKIVIPQSDVPTLYGDLIDEYEGNGLNPAQGYVLTGLGELAAIQGDGAISQSDQNVVARLTQTIFDNDARIGGTGNLGTDTNTAMTALEGPITQYLHGFDLVGTPQGGASGSSTTFPGILNGLIASNGKDVQAYVDFGSRIAAAGVPGLSFLNGIVNLVLNDDEASPLPSLQDYLLKAALGEAGGTLSTVVGTVGGIGAVGSLIFSINAVDNALGINDQQKDALEGSFGILNETGNLIGNILTGELASVGSAAVSASIDLGDAFADMGNGNTSGLISNAEGVATFMYEMSNFGFSPEDLGADAETFGATMVDLFSGNTGNLAADGAALGAALLHTLTNNLFVASAMDTVEEAIANINADWNEFLIGIGYNSPPPPPPPPPPPTITLPDGTTVPLINDTQGDGGKAYADPDSTSNYGQFYHGTATDGYIANANVFVDPTGAGVFQTGDFTTTTDTAGNYSLPAGITGTVVITGGTDIATGLPFTGTFTAPTGATSVTALTSLINAIAQTNGGDVAAATQQVDAALGLASTVDPTQTNPILSTQNGSSNSTQLLSATVQVQNTLSLLTAAGGSNATAALANAITGLSGGATLDLTDPTVVANIATSAGVDAMTAAATGMLASASNSAVQQQAANATSAQSLLTNVTAISIVTQGSTAQQLSQSIGNTAALSNTVSNNTGSNLTSQVVSSLSQVGNLSPVSLNPASGTLGAGAKVEVTLNVAEPVSVDLTNGTPTLALNVNENATYDATESTSTALVFDYTVQAGDNTPELETTAGGISLNGGAITDLVTNQPANLSGAQSAVPAGLLTINTTPPPTPSTPVLAAASALGSPSDDIANTSAPTFTGTAEAGTTVTLYAGTMAVGSAVAGVDGYSVTLTYPLAQGSYAFTATATNGVGTVSAASAATTVSLPGIPAITGTVSDQPTILDAPIAPFAKVAVTDPAADATETLTITLAGGGGTLAGSGLGGGSGTYTLAGSAAAVTSELDALVFTPTPAGTETASTTVFELDDQSTSLPVPVLGMASVTDYGTGTIVGVAPSIATGTVRAGGALTITLTMSSPVTVSGTPTLSLNDGGTATYDATASTSAALVFDYTVGQGEQTTALAVTGVNLPNGATIVDGLGNDAGLTLPPSANFNGLRIDTNPPGALTGNGLSDLLMLDSNTGVIVVDEMASGTMTYTAIGGLGPEWQSEGDGSFLGGTDGFLLWDGSSASPNYGVLVVGEDAGGTAQYSEISGLGPEWQFEGNGPLLGGSSDDFLLWGASTASPNYGILAVGAVVGAAVQYTEIGGVGPEWQFEGVGDYLGDGKTGFLMEDGNNGALAVGEVNGGSAQYSLVGGLGAEWQVEGTGNLLGHGQDDFLIWDGSSASPNYGVLAIGEVTGGSAQYTAIGGVGPEWQFLGVGDYDGVSSSEFLIRNSNSGVLVLGTVSSTNGTYGVTYNQVGGVGPEWNFHNTPVATGV